MPSLLESLTRIGSRVELFASGVDADRREAELMLERRRPLDAREHARAILARLPESPVGLALWADAAEGAWLDDEAHDALTALAAIVPWRADVWLRLGRVGLRLGRDGAREALERAATAPDERAAARLALLELCDLDLAEGDPARALRWLDRVPVDLAAKDEAVLLRRAEGAFALGRLEEAAALCDGLEDGIGEEGRLGSSEELARRALVIARSAWAKLGDPPDPLVLGAALRQALRAYVLDARGARELLAAVVARTNDAKTLAELRAIVAGAGDYEAPSFVAAFALAEGRAVDARAALVAALRGGEAAAAAPLLELAREARDGAALQLVKERAAAALGPADAAVLSALEALAGGRGAEALAALDGASDGPLGGWAAALRLEACRALLAGERRWDVALSSIEGEARALDDANAFTAIERLSKDRARPISVAIVGEFNAGKSTFINALLGVDVAPTGILPTTATLHRVAWAPDPFARVLLRGAPDRTVPHAELKRTLSELGARGEHVERVQIYAPIERLRWVEILDTPGFNAVDPDHARTAREAFGEADVVVWLLDGTGPLKASEGEILRSVTTLGLPVVVLVNKTDRLSPADLASVLAHVGEGLAELGVAPVAGPLPLSAKLALAGRLGDADALARSRWPDVEAMISATLVDQADRWRERGLARRAIAVIDALAQQADARAAQRAAGQEAQRAEVARLRDVARHCAQHELEEARRLRAAVAAGERALEADLRPLAAAAAPGPEGDLAMRTYAASRWLARLSDPLLDAFLSEHALTPHEVLRAAVQVALEAVALTFPLAAPSQEPDAQATAQAAWERVFVAVVRALRRALEERARLAAGAPQEREPRHRLAALRGALVEIARDGDAVAPRSG